MLGVLPASGCLFAEAIRSQKTEDVMPCFANSFKFWGVTPACLRVDNFKAAIAHAGKYGGELTPAMDAFARFFDVEVYACRSGCPKDKGCVEAHVKFFTRYALALANHHITNGGWFNNLQELNSFLKPLVAKMNGTARRGYVMTRQEHFELEKKHLRKPASWDYRLVDTLFITVPPTAVFVYHKHEYAIHPKWRGCRISVEISPESITFASGSHLIATYMRKDGIPAMSSMPGFLEQKTEIYEITCIDTQGPMLKEWAEHIGPNTQRWVERVMKSKIAYSDRVRHVVKVLSLPGGLIARGKELEACIEKLLKHYGSGYFPAQKIVDAYEAVKHAEDLSREPLYNHENYLQAGKAVIYGKTEIMSWTNCRPLTKPPRSEPEEFLNDNEHYSLKYAVVEAALAGHAKA